MNYSFPGIIKPIPIFEKRESSFVERVKTILGEFPD